MNLVFKWQPNCEYLENNSNVVLNKDIKYVKNLQDYNDNEVLYAIENNDPYSDESVSVEDVSQSFEEIKGSQNSDDHNK